MTQYPDVAAACFDPAQHYAEFGEAEGRDASAAFSACLYAQRHPEAVGFGLMLLHAEQHGQGEDGRPPVDPKAFPDVDTLLAQHFPKLQPLPVFAVPHEALRLSVVTDSIDPGSLRRGVGAAIIVAVLTAKRIGATLRIITRTRPPDPSIVAALLDEQRIKWVGNMDFVHAPAAEAPPGLPVGSGDRFIVTCWSAAWATRLSVSPARIAYLVHEDERSNYPVGDDQLRCSELLRDSELLYVAESEALLQSLQADGLAPGGTALSSSFPDMTHAAAAITATDYMRKRRFLLDASPLVPSSLYWKGLEALAEAMDTGVLDPAVWSIHFAGSGMHDVTLPGGVNPIVLDHLTWTEYTVALRTMDLVLRMLNPPPAWLDVAAYSTIVVTSGPALDDRVEPDIIHTEPDLASLVAALREGAQRVMERPRAVGTTRPHDNGLKWDHLAAPAIDRLASWAEQ